MLVFSTAVVGPVIRTAGILTQLAKGTDCNLEPAIRLYPCLIGFNHRRLGTKGNAKSSSFPSLRLTQYDK